MELRLFFLACQMFCLVGIVISGVLALRRKNLFNPWYMRIMYGFLALVWFFGTLVLVN